MSDPMTAAQACDEMMAWATGQKSHHNQMLQVTGIERRPEALVAVAQADAAETTRWAAVFTALTCAEYYERSERQMFGGRE